VPERIGYVPQLKTFDRTFPATAVELVVTGLRRSWPARPSRSSASGRAPPSRRSGAEALADRPLSRLSGGELQRVYLARAVAREPAFVLLDEPATGVDYLAEHDLYDLLERYQARTRRDRGDGDARPRGRALPRQPRAGPQPPGLRLRPPRRRPLRRLPAGGVRPRRSRPRAAHPPARHAR
jgi:hypothetical protein